MAPTIRSDCIVDSGITKQYNQLGVPTFIQIDRSFWLDGIDQTQSEAVQTIAIDTIQSHIPVGTKHPTDPDGRIALSRYYRVVPNKDSQSGVRVIVSYVYDALGLLDTQWTVESDTFLEQQETDSQYDSSGNLKPVVVDNYLKNWVFNGPKPSDAPLIAYGTVPVLKPRKRVVMTRTIFSQADAITLQGAADSYVGAVNSGSFLFKPAYSYLCMDVDVIFEPYKGQYLGKLEFIYRPETWKEWLRFANRELGTPPNIWKADSSGHPNGMKQITPYQTADLNALVNLLT